MLTKSKIKFSLSKISAEKRYAGNYETLAKVFKKW